MIVDGWYRESGDDHYPGEDMSFEVKEVLDHHKSDVQDILAFESVSYGNILALDDVIICTQKDEFVHHEMIAHIPLFAHPDPKRVLVIGGGDGGILREITKHPSVEEIVVCENDKDVIEVSKKHFPEMSKGFDDPRVTVQVASGADFLAANQDLFDVIITTTAAPIGPKSAFFATPFHDAVYANLKEGGIACTQGQWTWAQLPVIGPLVQAISKIYTTVEFANFYVPTSFGQIGFIIATKGREKCNKPARLVSADVQATLQYYTPALHTAAFALPAFVRKAIFEG